MSALRGLLLALVIGAQGSVVASDIAASNGAVVQGEWNANFSAVLDMARREHRPMLLIHTSEGCPMCARLNHAIGGEAFYQWQRDRKLLMAYVRTSGTDVEREKVNGFIKSVSGELSGYPYVCVYWPKPDGTTNGVAFVGRRGEMGVERKDLFSVEFMTALDQALKEYLAQDPKKYASIDQIVSNSTKTISCAKAGAEGSVTMRPESGILPEGGKVTLEARPASDALFVGWEDPHGQFVEWNYRLVVAGRMPAGNYTARFREKKGCPPPNVTTVSTSLCVQVGQRFKYAIPVDPSCRPVRFRPTQHLPKGLKFDKVSGELSGTLRKEGAVRMTVQVIGFDAANTVKSHSIDLKILPKKNSASQIDGAGKKSERK